MINEYSVMDQNIWRLRVNIEAAFNLKINEDNTLPSYYISLGWTYYENQKPDDENLKLTKLIEDERNPIWNEQFLVNPPSSALEKEGFLFVSLNNKILFSNNKEIFIPILPMNPFIPYYFELIFENNDDYNTKSRVYISIILEELYYENFNENFVEIKINSLNIDPFPFKVNICRIIMVIDNFENYNEKYITYSLKDNINLAEKILEYNNLDLRIFKSKIINFPHQKDSISFYCLKNYLNLKIKFYILFRNNNVPSNTIFPNCLVGETNSIENNIKSIYYNQKQKSGKIFINWIENSKLFNAFRYSIGNLEITCQSESKFLNDSNNSSFFENSLISRKNLDLNKIDDIAYLLEKNQPYFDKLKNNKNINNNIKENLHNKQDYLVKLMSDLDLKDESLKLSAAEIINIRKEIELNLWKNSELKKKVKLKENLNVNEIINKEKLFELSNEDLRNKIIKLARAYRNERIINEKIEKKLKEGKSKIQNQNSLLEIINKLRNDIKKINLKFNHNKDKIQKIFYLKTKIQKNEDNIIRLEKLLKSNNNFNIKNKNKTSYDIKVDEYISKNIELKNKLKLLINENNKENFEIFNKKKDYLLSEIQEIKKELNSDRPKDIYLENMENEIIKNEVKYKNLKSRSEALEEEFNFQSQKNAKILNSLKIQIQQKEFLLNNDSVYY